jgi:hypothetical protein
MTMTIGRTSWFPGVVVKAGRTTWFPSASTWRRSEAPAWRRTRRTRRRACGGGTRGGGADTDGSVAEKMTELGFRGLGTLKKRILPTGGVDYVSTPVAKEE